MVVVVLLLRVVLLVIEVVVVMVIVRWRMVLVVMVQAGMMAGSRMQMGSGCSPRGHKWLAEVR